MTRNKVGKKIRCECGYEWVTKSKMLFVTCPNCLKKCKAQED